jgi:hypothetical protein
LKVFQTTVYGGVNKSTSVFGCTNDGIYNTPDVGKEWPACKPELNSELPFSESTNFLEN